MWSICWGKKKQTKKVSYNALYKKIDRLVSTALEAVVKLLHGQAVFWPILICIVFGYFVMTAWVPQWKVGFNAGARSSQSETHVSHRIIPYFNSEVKYSTLVGQGLEIELNNTIIWIIKTGSNTIQIPDSIYKSLYITRGSYFIHKRIP